MTDKKYYINKKGPHDKSGILIEFPPVLDLDESAKNFNIDAMNKKFNKILREFKETLERDNEKEDLTNFYNNLCGLKISNSPFFIKIIKKMCNVSRITCFYNTNENHIYLEKGCSLKAVWHELMHMASTSVSQNIVFSGFAQANFNESIRIGIGITEGYTEYKTHEYIKSDNDWISSINYQYLEVVTSQLEKIVGATKMTKLYLNANLPGLIDELQKYYSKEDIIQFIVETDFIFQNLNDAKVKYNSNELLFRYCNNVNKFLVAAMLKKMLNKLQNKEINEENFYSYIKYYMSETINAVTFNSKSFQFFTSEDYMNIYEKTLLEMFGKAVQSKVKKLKL